MIEQTNTTQLDNEDDFNLKELIGKTKEWMNFLLSKWLIICFTGILGSGLGYTYAYLQKPVYTASLSFALEDEKSNAGGGLASAMGLASTLGIDLGNNAGGAFTGANLIELIKSRNIVEKALLSPIIINNRTVSLADYFIEFNEIILKDGSKISLPVTNNRSSFTITQDSLLGKIYETIALGNILYVAQKDRRVSIIVIETRSENELFSKVFTENVAKEVSTFYVDSKSKKARINVNVLQRQVDSIRNELNEAITGVAVANDNIYNLNSSLNVKRTPSSKRQVDVTANSAILTQLVTNLEMAKVTLLKETPLIQVIDKPILPLKKDKVSKLKSLLMGGIVAGLLMVFWVLGKKIYGQLMK